MSLGGGRGRVLILSVRTGGESRTGLKCIPTPMEGHTLTLCWSNPFPFILSKDFFAHFLVDSWATFDCDHSEDDSAQNITDHISHYLTCFALNDFFMTCTDDHGLAAGFFFQKMPAVFQPCVVPPAVQSGPDLGIPVRGYRLRTTAV